MATILIVEDDEEVSRCLKNLLVPLGHSLCIASTGPQALMAVQSSAPDIIILDLDMPGMNGVETYRRLAAACPNGSSFGTVFLTGAAETPLFDEALDLGVPDVLLKPPCPMQVQLAIKLQLHLLRRRRARQQTTACGPPPG